MNKTWSIRNLQFGALACSALLTALPKEGVSQQKKNVLFIMADDFNYWTGAQGYYPKAHTPHLDSLTAKGILFTDAHCSSPVCNPSRNALWSGYRPSTTGIQGNEDGFVRDVQGFANITSMHQYFKQNGYFTYGSGKLWHPGSMGAKETDPANWTQINECATGCAGGSVNKFESTEWDAMIYSANPAALSESNCNDFKMVKQVASLISGYATSANKDKPFFIGCGIFRPHLPWNSPKQFWDLFVESQLTKPAGYTADDLNDIGESPAAVHTELVNKNKWMQAIQAYLACCALADSNVSILLDALNKSPYKNNTIVVFTGDHGWHLGEKMKWGKNTLYDQANRTTLIIYDPSAAGNGKKCRKVVGLQDVYPTLIELCGLPVKTDIEGGSLAPLLENPERTDWTRPALMSYADKNYIKTNEYRFIDFGNKYQLYDMVKDPYEWDNLSGKPGSDAIAAKLRAQIDSLVQIGRKMKAKLLANVTFSPQKNVLPGLIEVENYDEGADGQAFHDADNTNSGGKYRKDGVDIEVTQDIKGSFDITSTESGEWLRYTISELNPGTYEIQARVANASGTGKKLVYYIENRKAGEITVPVTGGAQTWQTVVLPNIQINEKGYFEIRVEISGAGFNINYFEFIKTGSVGTLLIRDNGAPGFLINKQVRDGRLYLDLTRTGMIAKIDIYTLGGTKVIEDVVIGEQRIVYNLTNGLASGSYLLRVRDNANVDKVEMFIYK